MVTWKKVRCAAMRMFLYDRWVPTILGKKVEIKNMNSMRNVQHAIDYEIGRQIGCLEQGESIISDANFQVSDDGKRMA